MRSRLLMLLAAVIWGGGFVAQSFGATTIGPYAFNMFRFIIGTVAITPLLFLVRDSRPVMKPSMPLWTAAALVGLMVFFGMTFQQMAMAYTTVGKAAFITGLYMVMVPILGFFFGEKLSVLALIGVIVAVVGSALLTLKGSADGLSLEYGDILLFANTIFWAAQILMLSRFAPCYPAIRFTWIQLIWSAVFASFSFFLFETVTWDMIWESRYSLIYIGAFSTALGFTLQLVGQKHVPPTESSLILSLEMVFGALLGWIILGELMNVKEFIGVVLIAGGVLLAQIPVSAKYMIDPARKR